VQPTASVCSTAIRQRALNSGSITSDTCNILLSKEKSSPCAHKSPVEVERPKSSISSYSTSTATTTTSANEFATSSGTTAAVRSTSS
jgi:hypothetical protein